MPSYFSGTRIKQHLVKQKNFFVIVIIPFCCFFGFVLLVTGSQELYKSSTFVIHECQVKTIDLKFEVGKLHPRWNITVVYENQRIDHFIIASTGLTSESDAWSEAHKHEINQTYLCYRSRNETSIIQWTWQWNKPSKLKAYGSLFGGVSLSTIAVVLIILIRRYQIEFTNTRRQQQLEMSVIAEEQQQSTPPPESPPPAYDEVVQWPIRNETRT